MHMAPCKRNWLDDGGVGFFWPPCSVWGTRNFGFLCFPKCVGVLEIANLLLFDCFWKACLDQGRLTTTDVVLLQRCIIGLDAKTGRDDDTRCKPTIIIMSLSCRMKGERCVYFSSFESL